ncbi:hypothetical protein KR222_008573 [Zaprionus bogoriensis]|nr:hypothetical protein KR222_008573 [Zaprionus bogoriensis]
MCTLLAALALMPLLLRVEGNRFAAYDELLPRSLPKFWPDQLQAQEETSDAELAQGTSKMLNAFFGLTAGGPQTTARPAEQAALNPYQLPPMYYNDFYEDLLTSKRNDVHAAGCDCKVMNDLLDLGSGNFPRYLMSAVCESRCTQGSKCKPLEYKVKVLTLSSEQTPQSQSQSQPAPGKPNGSSTLTRLWLPEQLSAQSLQWHFRTVTVTAGCFCTN